MAQQPHVPVRRPAGADMAEHARVAPGQVLGADRGHRPGPHLGDGGGVDDGARHAGGRVHEQQQRQLGRQPRAVVVHVVAHDLDAGERAARRRAGR